MFFTKHSPDEIVGAVLFLTMLNPISNKTLYHLWRIMPHSFVVVSPQRAALMGERPRIPLPYGSAAPPRPITQGRYEAPGKGPA